MSKREVEDIDEAALLTSINEKSQMKFAKNRAAVESLLTEEEKQTGFFDSFLNIAPNVPNKQGELSEQSKAGVHSEPNVQTASTESTVLSYNSKRISGKQRKLAFEEI